MGHMRTLKARVKNGRLVLDEPTGLPEGTVLNLVAAEAGDDLDAKERAALHRALRKGWASLRGGRRVAAKDVLRDVQDLD